MWNQFPKHLMEPRVTLPKQEVEFLPLKEIKEKKVRPHRVTKIVRKKYAFEDKN